MLTLCVATGVTAGLLGGFAVHEAADGPGVALTALRDAQSARARGAGDADDPRRDGPSQVVRQYCVGCHNQRLKTAGLALDLFDAMRPNANPEVWEKAIRRLRMRTMPPDGMPRPDEVTYDELVAWFETEIDRASNANPSPGRITSIHRMNRTEYNNGIRDLLALDVDVRSLLPGDETQDGYFDNFADALSISTSHLERYMAVARHVSRLAVGLPPAAPTGEVFEVPLHIEQADRMSQDLPFGSRGGLAVRYHFPVDGEYRITIRLRRQYADYLLGMGWAQRLDVRLDGVLLQRFTVGGNAPPGKPAPRSFAGAGTSFGDPEWEEFMQLTGDLGLEVQVPVQAGPRVVGVSFVRDLWEPEGVPQPLQRGRVLTNDNLYMENAAVHSVEIGGPFRTGQSVSDTPSRSEIFKCHPQLGANERACATEILSRLARRA
jgi:mono/diheme cytochrome c family protein